MRTVGRWLGEHALGVGNFAIAVLALYVAYSVRCDSRRTSEPMLSMSVVQGEGLPGAIRLKNGGMGPAKIRGVAGFVDDELVARKLSLSGWESVLVRAGFVGDSVNFQSLDADDTVYPGAEVLLLVEREGTAGDAPKRAKLLRAMERIGLAVCYCSMFDECFVAVTGVERGVVPACSSGGFIGSK